MNNKGFAISAVLYTLLISFLLFLGVTLAMFQSSISLTNNANKDLLNNNKLGLVNVSPLDKNGYKKGEDGTLFHSKEWYQADMLVKVNSRYGIVYWPKDVSNYSTFTPASASDGSFTKDKLKWYLYSSSDPNGSILTSASSFETTTGEYFALVVVDSGINSISDKSDVNKCENGVAKYNSTTINGTACVIFDDNWVYVD